MTIQPIGDGSVALYITHADLCEQGVAAEDLTAEHALALAREAFSQAGLSPEGEIEIEAYPDKYGVLVFARVKPRQRLWVSFPDSEPLLRALWALPELPRGAALTWWEGRYWLSVGAPDKGAQAVLSEYGDTEHPSPAREEELLRRGERVAAGEGVAALLRCFSGKR